MSRESDSGIFTDERQVAPAHYTLKIDSWSFLLQVLAESYSNAYESRHFEASGYKWKLALYPNIHKIKNGDDHIFIYLMVAETKELPPGWEINTLVRFFVYDQLQDKYFTIEDGKVKRFHALKTKMGLRKLLPLATFNDESKGYLVDDSCAFGVEVFVLKNEGKGEHLSMIKDPPDGTFTWKIDKFSELTEDVYYSKAYSVGGHSWKLVLYPDGNSRYNVKSLSLFLKLDNFSKLPHGRKLYVKYTLRVRNQVTSHHRESEHKKWFDGSETGWGSRNFVPRSFLNDASNGLLVNDSLIIEGIINLLYEVKDFF